MNGCLKDVDEGVDPCCEHVIEIPPHFDIHYIGADVVGKRDEELRRSAQRVYKPLAGVCIRAVDGAVKRILIEVVPPHLCVRGQVLAQPGHVVRVHPPGDFAHATIVSEIVYTTHQHRHDEWRVGFPLLTEGKPAG